MTPDTDRRFPLTEARTHAEAVLTALTPACVRIEIAGSIRRGKESVKDIEIVALPIYGVDLFGDMTGASLAMERSVTAAVLSGLLRFDADVKRNGPRYKRLIHCVSGMAVDLFLADADNYGNVLAIRTGDSSFSQELMIAARRRGLVQRDGYLYNASSGLLVPCPSERAYFAAIGWAWVEPEQRNLQTANLRRSQETA